MSLRVLHTADWHLGQVFHGFDRDLEHSRFLGWLGTTIASRKPDVLVVSGDVFDSINPSAVAQRRYWDFLAAARSAVPHLRIVITAGNHDAAARLEAPSALFASIGISVVGTVPRFDDGAMDCSRFLVPLQNREGMVEAIAVAIPFLRPSDVPACPGAADPYLDGIAELYRQATAAAVRLRDEKYPGVALIALGHLHVAGGEESHESERRVVVGGAEAVSPAMFSKELAYVALGHLHKPQDFDGGRIVYSGSPLPLSFSERDYAHRVLELTFDAGRLAASEPISVPKAVSLIRVPVLGAASIEEIPNLINTLQVSASLSGDERPFLEIDIAEDRPNPELRRTIERVLEGKPFRLALIKRVAIGTPAVGAIGLAANTADLQALQPDDIVIQHHLEVYGSKPDPDLLAALREIQISVP